MAGLAKESAVIVPQKLTGRRRLASWVVLNFMRLCMKTWRVHWQDAALCPVLPGPVIFLHLAQPLALAMTANGEFVREKWPSAGLCAMISASRDGAFFAGLVEPFGVVPIRGSTSRRGPQALLEATTWMEKNYNIAITPDGPRGPVYKVQEGIIHLAQLTGRPIVPMSNYVRAKSRLEAGTGSKFPCPSPAARCVGERLSGSPATRRRRRAPNTAGIWKKS